MRKTSNKQSFEQLFLKSEIINAKIREFFEVLGQFLFERRCYNLEPLGLWSKHEHNPGVMIQDLR